MHYYMLWLEVIFRDYFSHFSFFFFLFTLLFFFSRRLLYIMTVFFSFYFCRVHNNNNNNNIEIVELNRTNTFLLLLSYYSCLFSDAIRIKNKCLTLWLLSSHFLLLLLLVLFIFISTNKFNQFILSMDNISLQKQVENLRQQLKVERVPLSRTLME